MALATWRDWMAAERPSGSVLILTGPCLTVPFSTQRAAAGRRGWRMTSGLRRYLLELALLQG